MPIAAKVEAILNLDMMKKTTLCSIGILIAFFLPWIDVYFFTLNGYEIATKFKEVFEFCIRDHIYTESSKVEFLSYFYFLIPISALLNIFLDLVLKKRRTRIIFDEFTYAILGVGLIFFLLQSRENIAIVLKALGIGFYLTLLIAVLGFIFRFKEEKERKQQNNKQNNNSDNAANDTKLTENHSNTNVVEATLTSQVANENQPTNSNNNAVNATQTSQVVNENNQINSHQKEENWIVNILSLIVNVLSLIIPLIGFIMYFVWRTKFQDKARSVLVFAIIGFVINFLILMRMNR